MSFQLQKMLLQSQTVLSSVFVVNLATRSAAIV
jgi:hypothetical protein